MTASLRQRADSPLFQEAQIKQLLTWLTPLTLGFALLAGVAFWFSGDGGTGVTALALFGYCVLTVVARYQLRRRKLQRAVAMVSIGFLVATLVVAPAQPTLIPTLVVAPLLAVMVALPSAGGTTLRRLILVTWLTALAVAVMGEILPPDTTLPPWFESLFRVMSLATTVAVVLLLLWQFSSRLTRTLEQTRAAEERYALAARGANDGLWDWDLVTDRIYLSPRWKEMLGYREHEIGDSPEEWLDRIHEDDQLRVRHQLEEHLNGDSESFESEHRILHKDGGYRWVLNRGLAVRNEEGVATRIAGSQTDITQRKQAEERLMHDALHDELTGLPNRTMFMRRLNRVVKRARWDRGYVFAVLFLDLDRFKNINDSLGHTVGDAMLTEITRRLERCLRPGDMIARLGGDEFTILLDDINEVEDARMVAERIQEALKVPFSLNGYELFTTASIGIAINTGNQSPENLLRDADTAMYRAKELGRARHEVFDPAMHSSAVALLQMETDLRRAIEREEFVVHYQPIVSLKTGRIAGLEALLRWEHPQKGLLTPEEFLSVAEETGLILPIGWFVLRRACEQMREWQRHIMAYPLLAVDVNFSATQLAQPDFTRQLAHVLSESGLEPRRLRLEITESVIMQSPEAASEMLERLRELDVRVHIDDFGMGYSSLSMLHNFPIDSLKVDRSFVGRIGAEGEDLEIVQTIITLAHNLGMDVIAEGVETEDQLAHLRTLGCDYGQGYLFSRPVPAERMGEMILSDPQW
jgi:diguanylate cyclase (GGDEF)-like protein/PAS domain S-box-containing protein